MVQTGLMIRTLDFAHPAIIILIVILGLWEAVWKAIALWQAGRNRHLAWFIVMFILNTAGILEIVYIFAVGRPALRAKEASAA
ncbi:MAG: hypothetical protein JWN80_838 [Microbacteriaceae bacterium]|nr:hypothetical protein [Microbacteriaceae bacterium]